MTLRSVYILLALLLALPLEVASLNPPDASTSASTSSARRLSNQGEADRLEFCFLEAVRERLAEHYEEAIECLDFCEAIDPENDAVKFEYASVYLLQGQKAKAMEYLERAIALAPDNEWYRLSLAMLYIASNDWKSAGAIYEKMLETHPDDEEYIYYLSQIYSTTGDWQKLIDLLDLHERRYGVSEEVSLQKFQAYSALKKPKKAAAEIDALVRAFPDEGKYRVMRGKIYADEGNTAKALECYDRAMATDPNNGVVYLAYAEYYSDLGNEAKAVEYLEQALRNRTMDETAKMTVLGEYLKRTEHSEQGNAQLEKLLVLFVETHPESVEVRLVYARFLLAVRRYDEAEAQFRLALTHNPKDAEAWYGLVQIKVTQNDFDGMLRTAGEAIEQTPDKGMFYYYEGVAYMHRKDYARAIDSYERGLARADSTDFLQRSDLLFGIAEVYRTQGEHTQAFAYYDRALEINEYNMNVLNNYAYTLSEENQDLDKAEQMIKTCLQLVPKEASYLDTYGWILYKQGYYNLARNYIEDAILNGAGGSREVLNHYGDILLQLDDPAGAVEQWKKSLNAEGETDNSEAIKAKILQYETKLP